MAAAAPLAGVGSILGGLTSAFGNQSRAPAGSAPARVDTSTAALAGARDEKHLRAMARNADKERMLAVLTDPQVMGLLVTFGGLALATRIPFHENKKTNRNLQGIAAASAVLMGLGRAGVGDLTTLALATGTGTAIVLGAPMESAGDVDGSGAGSTVDTILDYGTWHWPGTDIPAASIWGPIPGIKTLWDWIT